jgi:hypothetical protein
MCPSQQICKQVELSSRQLTFLSLLYAKVNKAHASCWWGRGAHCQPYLSLGHFIFQTG